MSQLYFSDPSSFNDPFDCHIDPLSALNRALETDLCSERRKILGEVKVAFEERDPRLKERAVCCFCSNMESLLMWSHYADSHRGVCLMYEFPADYIPTRYAHRSSETFFVGATPVQYRDNWYFSWLCDGDMDDPIDGEPTVNAAAWILAAKSEVWSYEEEFRMIMSAPGAIQIEPEHLKQVTFGLRTSEVHKSLIKKTLMGLNDKVLFVQAYREGTTDFGLNFVDLV